MLSQTLWPGSASKRKHWHLAQCILPSVGNNSKYTSATNGTKCQGVRKHYLCHPLGEISKVLTLFGFLLTMETYIPKGVFAQEDNQWLCCASKDKGDGGGVNGKAATSSYEATP